MEKIRIGVLCPSEIAFRRFMPALLKQADFEYVGIACADEQEWFGEVNSANDCSVLEREKEKAQNFAQSYSGRMFESYHQLLMSDEVDAVYLPLPPALHYKWGKAALQNGKHLLMEKPFTTSLQETQQLLKVASENGLAVHENYMFEYHSQLDSIQQIIAQGEIGELRLIRIAFGFPFRGASDFRYDKVLGGGALLDCGGYTIKLASLLLGESARVATSNLNLQDNFDVDIYGSATMVNDSGLTAQLSFGMDNSYKCELELWGSKGILYTNRILTAPQGYEPVVLLKTNDGERSLTLQEDDSFYKSIQAFGCCIADEMERKSNIGKILKQAELVNSFTDCLEERL